MPCYNQNEIYEVTCLTGLAFIRQASHCRRIRFQVDTLNNENRRATSGPAFTPAINEVTITTQTTGRLLGRNFLEAVQSVATQSTLQQAIAVTFCAATFLLSVQHDPTVGILNDTV